jgi:hypothetical protein
MPLVGFDQQSALRIAKAVKRVEGMTDSQPRPGRGGGGVVYCKKGKLDGTLSEGGTATMSVWHYSGGYEVDSGDNITVRDWLLASGQYVSSGKKVVAAFMRGPDGPKWYVIAAECA